MPPWYSFESALAPRVFHRRSTLTGIGPVLDSPTIEKSDKCAKKRRWACAGEQLRRQAVADYWQQFTSNRISRRRVLAATGAMSMAAAIAAACGGGSSSGTGEKVRPGPAGRVRPGAKGRHDRFHLHRLAAPQHPDQRPRVRRLQRAVRLRPPDQQPQQRERAVRAGGGRGAGAARPADDHVQAAARHDLPQHRAGQRPRRQGGGRRQGAGVRQNALRRRERLPERHPRQGDSAGRPHRGLQAQGADRLPVHVASAGPPGTAGDHPAGDLRQPLDRPPGRQRAVPARPRGR